MRYKLTSICDFQGGSQPPKAEWSFENEEGYIRMLQIRDFTQSERVIPEFIKITATTKTCEDDDILIARYGASIGKILTGLSGAYNVAIMKTIPDTTKISKKYLYYFLKSPYFQNSILNVGSRAAQAGFNKEDLAKLEINCPDIVEQNDIICILEKVEKIIANRKQQLDDLDNLIKSRFVEMFGKEIDNTAEELRNLCAKITDGTHQSPQFVQEGIPFIFISNIQNNKINYDTEKYISQKTYDELTRSTAIELGDVLLTIVGSYGNPAVVDNDKKFCFQRHIAQLKPKHDLVNSYYLHTALRIPYVREQIDRRVKGIAQKTLNLSELCKVKINVPELSRQNEFVTFIQRTDKLKVEVKKSLDETQLLFDSLMQRYFE